MKIMAKKVFHMFIPLLLVFFISKSSELFKGELFNLKQYLLFSISLLVLGISRSNINKISLDNRYLYNLQLLTLCFWVFTFSMFKQYIISLGLIFFLLIIFILLLIQFIKISKKNVILVLYLMSIINLVIVNINILIK